LNDEATVRIMIHSFDGSSIIITNSVETETCYDHEVIALQHALDNAYSKASKALSTDEEDYELCEEDKDGE
jgi:hypothetical protein